MFFWTNIPWNIFQSTGSLSIGAVLPIKKKNDWTKCSELWNCGMSRMAIALLRASDFNHLTVHFWEANICFASGWRGGWFPWTWAGFIAHLFLSPASPTCRHLGLPQSSKPWSQDPVLLVGPALLTGLFPPRKWVKAYQKPLTNNFFFLKLQKDFGFFQVQTGMAEESER